MLELSLATLVMLCAAAALAGWVDAVVGGGGLLMVPALLLGLPQHAPAYALGTNKAVAVTGTTVAAVTYARRHPVDVRLALRFGGLAFASAALGASFATAVSKEVLQPLIMVLLLAVAAFVVLRPAFGTVHSGRIASRRRAAVALLVAGLLIGFYDGLLGPGTGTFLIMAFVGLPHMTMLLASHPAMVVNGGAQPGSPEDITLHVLCLIQN